MKTKSSKKTKAKKNTSEKEKNKPVARDAKEYDVMLFDFIEKELSNS